MTKSLLVFLSFSFIFLGNTFAQEKLIERGNKQYKEYSYSLSINVYQRLLEKNKVPDSLKPQVLRNLANSYYFIADYDRAAEVYKKLQDQFKDSVGAATYFRYAQALKSQGKMEEANKLLAEFMKLSPEEAKFMEGTIAENVGQYKLVSLKDVFKNLKDSINYPRYSDFAPAFYKEGLIFSSDRDTGNLAKYRHTWTGKDFLDLYVVKNDGFVEGKITKINFEGDDFTTRVHESTSALTRDGKTLYFTGTNFKDGKYIRDENKIARLKIYKAQQNEEGVWMLVNDNSLSFNNDEYSTANPALSPDEKTLYFTSDMPGSKGQSDIYSASLFPDGVFRLPKNLGDIVNTELRETFPFVSNDSVLYFASDGHTGLGGLDIFSVQLNNGEVTGAVTNLGEPINSNKDDFTFIFNSEKRQGFFASNRKSAAGGEDDDIYSFVKTVCNQAITGTVRNKFTNQVLVGATVKVIDENNNEIYSTFTDQNGNYSVTVDRYRKNFVRALIEGFVGAEEYLEIAPCTPRMIDFYLEPIEVPCDSDLSKLLGLQPVVFFDFDKATIRPDGRYQLDIVIAAMEKYPSLKIKLKAHTDAQGPDAYNLGLSERRAQSSLRYILENGNISPDRLQAQGYGETQLANTNCPNGVRCSNKEHEKNRRTEFMINCDE